MKAIEIEYQPIEGKTYTLFGSYSSTSEYYGIIKSLCDRIQEKAPILSVIDVIQKHASRKRYLKKILINNNDSLISYCINLINNELKQFTQKTEEHLKNLSIVKLWDRRLSTTEEQYHLYMLEIELTNRSTLR